MDYQQFHSTLFPNLVQMLQQGAIRWSLWSEELQLTYIFISSQNYLLMSGTVLMRKQLKVHGHGQTHSRNFCRFKLDI